MHPILAHGRRLAWYLFIWSIVGLSFCMLLSAQTGLSPRAAIAVGLPLALAFAFVCLSAWYVSRYTPLGKAAPARLIGSAVGAAVLSSAAWVALARGWCAVLERWGGVVSPFETVGPIVFGFGQIAYLISLAVSYIAGAAEQARIAEHRALQVQVLSREAELRSLRAQIDPHFLFNSLHSISALTSADPGGARRMCLLLADFLRESLTLGGEDRITLAREIALLDRFLAIERIRFGDRLRVQLSAGDAGSCFVPPLLLQPIVENAVTHGIAHLIEGGTIRVTADRTGAWLRIVIENPCDPDRPPRRGAGVGLANVKARLRAMHGTEAALIAGEHNEIWRVELTLPAAIGEPS